MHATLCIVGCAVVIARCEVQADGASWANSESHSWKPYERASSEVSMFLPRIPRHFFKARWAAMSYNPLCWHPLKSKFTVGELLVVLVLLGQLLWTSIAWLLDLSDYRHDVKKTGAPTLHLCTSLAHACTTPLHGKHSRRCKQLRWHSIGCGGTALVAQGACADAMARVAMLQCNPKVAIALTPRLKCFQSLTITTMLGHCFRSCRPGRGDHVDAHVLCRDAQQRCAPAVPGPPL